MDDKSKSIEDAMKKLNKRFGDGAITLVGDSAYTEVESIPTGSPSLDFVLACGGLPRGRILETFGEESSGKSTLCLYLVAQVQKQGGKCVWIDAECSFTPEYAENIGVNIKDLIITQPETGEQGLTVLEEMVDTNAIDLIVVDSVAALVPRKELEADLAKEDIGLQARLMSKALRVLAGRISRTKTVVIFINQLRDKIGVFFGNKKSTPGGKALKFYSSVRLEVRRGTRLEDKSGTESTVVGNVMHVKAIKNKVGMPFRESEVEIIYKKGVNIEADVFDLAVRFGIIGRSGSTYSFEDAKIGVGRETVIAAFKTNLTEVYDKIKEALYVEIGERNSAERSTEAVASTPSEEDE
jgi:recombination protein RecA